MNNEFKAKDYRIVLSSYKDHKCVICGKTITKGSSYATRHLKIKNYFTDKDTHVNECLHLSCLENEVKRSDNNMNRDSVVINDLRKEIEDNKTKAKYYYDKSNEMIGFAQKYEVRNIELNKVLDKLIIETDKEVHRKALMEKLIQANNLQYEIEKLKEKLNEDN